MKTKLTIIIILLVSITSFAQTFTIDFINYNVTSTNPNTVEITGTSNVGGLGGNLIIPEIVTDNDIDYTVTSIAFRAFRQKGSIVSITIPATMVFIGNEAFRSTPLTEIIALGVTPPSISSGTFSDRDTTDITVPVGTETAYENVGWTGFASINGNPSLGFEFTADNGFTYAVISSDPNEVRLTNGNNASGAITISGTVIFNDISFRVTAIGSNSFRGNNVTSIVITSLVESIGNNAFRENTELSSVISNNTIAPTLGSNVFTDTASVKSLNIPDGSETSYADAGWSSNFFFVNGTPGIGSSFTADNGFTYTITSSDPNEVSLTNGNDASGAITISGTVIFNDISFRVTAIGANAFRDDSVTNLVITSLIGSIGNDAFRGNTELSSVTSNNTIAPTLGANVFRDTASVKSLNIPDGSEASYADAGWSSNFFFVNGTPEIGTSFTADNGYTYTITSSAPNEVSLTNGNDASGAITILGTVIFNDISFSVTAIGVSAFKDDTITSVVITSNVESIGSNAFRGNTGLSSVTSNNTVAPTLGTSVFLDTASVTSLNIPDGSETSYADADWSSNFFSVNGTTDIGASFTADKGFTYRVTSRDPNEVSLTNGNNASGDIIISEELTVNSISFSVTEIGVEAFRSNNVTSVIVPSSVTNINEGAFRRNSDLDAITINNPTPPVLGHLAFGEIASERILTVPSGSEILYINAGFTNYIFINGVGQIGSSFTADNGFTYTVTSGDPNEVSLTNGNNASGAITISGTVSFKDISSRVTAIGNNAFLDDTLTSVVITSLVESIGNNAFRGNAELSSVTSNNTVAPTLGTNVFLDTAENKSLSIPDGSETSYTDAGWSSNFFTINGNLPVGTQFEANNGFTYTVTSNDPNEVSLINGNEALGALTITDSVTFNDISFIVKAIGNSAFSNNQLTSVIIPENVISIGNNAFNNSTLTEVVTTGNTPATIETNTFGDRIGIDLTIPEGTETAYETANWTGFFSVNGELNNDSIGTSFQFNEINYTITAVNPNQVEVTGSSIEFNLIIPEIATFNNFDFNVTTIKGGAFRNSSLTSLVIPDNVTTIGASAFRNSDLASITLGSGLETIGELAFAGNGPQISITVKAILPPSIGANAIARRAQTDLTIPKGTTNAYQNSDWTGFKSYIEISELSVQLRVLLQGASLNPNSGEETLMRDDLRVADLLPTTSPYADALTTTANVFENEGENAIVDWVLIQLRDATDNTIVVAEQSALLERDGDVVTVDGVSNISFTQDSGDYFISINHRNHLGVITENTIVLSSTVTSLDFTNDSSLVAGGTTAIASLSSGVLAMFSGDANNDDGIRLTDRAQIRTVLGERDLYSNDDIDMNGIIQLSEITLLVQNLGNLQQFTTEE